MDDQLQAARRHYAAVNAATSAVIARFSEAQRAYRALEIDDAAFLAAHAEYRAQIVDFDAAYAALAALEGGR